MAVLKMQRINICGLKKNRKAILERLQSLGTLEIDMEWEEDELLQKMDTSGSRDIFEKHAQQTERALDILQKYAPEKKSMFSSLEGKPLIEKEDYDQIIESKEQCISNAYEIISLEKEISEAKAKILKLESRIEGLLPWINLKVPMKFEGTKQTAFLLGTIPGAVEPEQLSEMLAAELPEMEALEAEVISTGKDYTYLAVVCMRTDLEQVETGLRSFGFAKPSQMTRRIPQDAIAAREKEINDLRVEIAGLESQICSLESGREGMKLISDYFRVRADKYKVLGTLPQTRNTFMISGYAPVKAAARLAGELQDRFDAVVELEEIKEEEVPPIVLENNRFSESAEGVLAAFGLPGKGELDPTVVMSIFYVFLFGLMLSDAAYGLIVMIACGVALLRFPRMGTSMKKSLKLFFWCGVSTLCWGILFGGYFGDMIDVVARTFFNVSLPEGQSIIPAVWFVPLNDPMKMLIYSMLFGLIHLFTGLGIKGYICLKDKKYLDFFCDVVLWFLLMAGLLIMLLPSELFTSIAQMSIQFPPAVDFAGKLLAICGAVGILLMSGRETKNFGVRIALGAYDLYNITGWLSDILSYSRLLALGLATGVIASVINQMGSMGGGGVLGAVLFIVVFIIGHLFNLGINLLGAYVHTCRLQYVEFFGKFYEGGGREFTPFKENTKYVEIKEEN